MSASAPVSLGAHGAQSEPTFADPSRTNPQTLPLLPPAAQRVQAAATPALVPPAKTYSGKKFIAVVILLGGTTGIVAGAVLSQPVLLVAGAIAAVVGLILLIKASKAATKAAAEHTAAVQAQETAAQLARDAARRQEEVKLPAEAAERAHNASETARRELEAKQKAEADQATLAEPLKLQEAVAQKSKEARNAKEWDEKAQAEASDRKGIGEQQRIIEDPTQRSAEQVSKLPSSGQSSPAPEGTGRSTPSLGQTTSTTTSATTKSSSSPNPAYAGLPASRQRSGSSSLYINTTDDTQSTTSTRAYTSSSTTNSTGLPPFHSSKNKDVDFFNVTLRTTPEPTQKGYTSSNPIAEKARKSLRSSRESSPKAASTAATTTDISIQTGIAVAPLVQSGSRRNSLVPIERASTREVEHTFVKEPGTPKGGAVILKIFDNPEGNSAIVSASTPTATTTGTNTAAPKAVLPPRRHSEPSISTNGSQGHRDSLINLLANPTNNPSIAANNGFDKTNRAARGAMSNDGIANARNAFLAAVKATENTANNTGKKDS